MRFHCHQCQLYLINKWHSLEKSDVSTVPHEITAYSMPTQQAGTTKVIAVILIVKTGIHTHKRILSRTPQQFEAVIRILRVTKKSK
jgi:hypothetical protein